MFHAYLHIINKFLRKIIFQRLIFFKFAIEKKKQFSVNNDSVIALCMGVSGKTETLNYSDKALNSRHN